MSRKIYLINDLKRLYLQCSNPEKDEIISEAIERLKALTILPKED